MYMCMYNPGIVEESIEVIYVNLTLLLMCIWGKEKNNFNNFKKLL